MFSTSLFTLLLGIISQLVPCDDFLRWAIFYPYVQLVDKVLPKWGFEPWISGVGSECSTNCATATCSDFYLVLFFDESVPGLEQPWRPCQPTKLGWVTPGTFAGGTKAAWLHQRNFGWLSEPFSNPNWICPLLFSDILLFTIKRKTSVFRAREKNVNESFTLLCSQSSLIKQ